MGERESSDAAPHICAHAVKMQALPKNYDAERTKRLPGLTAALPSRQSGHSSGS
jgi:hypothetical protein